MARTLLSVPLFLATDRLDYTELRRQRSELKRGAGTPPAQVQSITIYASGHAFDSEITNVQLLGSE